MSPGLMTLMQIVVGRQLGSDVGSSLDFAERRHFRIGMTIRSPRRLLVPAASHDVMMTQDVVVAGGPRSDQARCHRDGVPVMEEGR